MFSLSDTLCNRASTGIGLTSQCTAPLAGPPVVKFWRPHCCWVKPVKARPPWSRVEIVTESSGVPASSVWNDTMLPARRSCVVSFSTVSAQ